MCYRLAVMYLHKTRFTKLETHKTPGRRPAEGLHRRQITPHTAGSQQLLCLWFSCNGYKA